MSRKEGEGSGERPEVESIDDNISLSKEEDLLESTPGKGKNEGQEPETCSQGPSVRRKLKTLTFGRKKKSHVCSASGGKSKEANSSSSSKKKKSSNGWGFKLCARTDSCADITTEPIKPAPSSCVCTGYRRTDEHPLGSGVVFNSQDEQNRDPSFAINRLLAQHSVASTSTPTPTQASGPVQNQEVVATGRARTVVVGVPGIVDGDPTGLFAGVEVEAMGGGNVMSNVQVRVSELALALRNQLALSPYPYIARWGEMAELAPGFLNRFCLRGDAMLPSAENLAQIQIHPQTHVQVHTQIDYIHRLVPDLLEITDCSFYWGKMDRYEAEKLLENRPEGTFLLRDSAQEEHLFSVSFRRFDRSLHARIEQWNHRFSFDSHDPGVFSSPTVCGLIHHYKDPSHCMFFEPMLTIPLHRSFPFSLQHLCRSTVCSRLNYDSVNSLQLPKRLKSFLKEYHYKQQVRVRRLDVEH